MKLQPSNNTGLLAKRHQLHFVGVGGSGMSGIAELCQKLGFAVTGCDLRAGANTARLEALGIPVAIGHATEHVGAGLDAVVISSAVKFSNPEVGRARALKIPVIPRAEMLGELLRLARVGIAVAGTHGKTTATSFIARILEEAGLDPTVAVGGNLRAHGTNARLGGGQFMVAEADESDASFLLLAPAIAVVTNIDPEHLDHYGSMEQVREAYLSFMNRVPFYGRVVLGIDSLEVRALAAAVRKPMVTYGLDRAADLRADEVRIEGMETRFTAVLKGRELGVVRLPLPGLHVALNALAALAVALEAGIDFQLASRALASFAGIQRRFEVKGELLGRIVLDDYAHHPAEVRATLAACRAAFARRTLVLFQPHRFTRLRDLFNDFLGAFDEADALYLMDVYPAGESPIAGVNSRRLYEALCSRGHLDVQYVGDAATAVFRLAADSAAGDLVVTMGAGDVYKVGERLLATLEEAAKGDDRA